MKNNILNAEEIRDFFLGETERLQNEKIIYYNYNEEKYFEYVRRLINTPVELLLEFIYKDNSVYHLSAVDIFQFSNFTDGTNMVCSILEENNNPGLKFIQIGAKLFDDNIDRKTGALTKYGENHVKLAEILGLSFSIGSTYYLSCYGYIYNKLESVDKERLLLRLILKSRLIRTVISKSLNGDVSVRSTLDFISPSTYNRRKSNINTVLNKLRESTEYDFEKCLNNVFL